MKLLILTLLLLANAYQCALGGKDTADGKERLSLPAKTSLSILLVAPLYSGHVFSLVSLGEELVRRGHNVTLCANEMRGTDLYPGLPEKAGVKFLRAGYDPMTQEEFDKLHESNQAGMFNFSHNLFSSSYRQIRTKIEEIGLDNFDVIVVDLLLLPTAAYFHEKGMKSITFTPALTPPIASWSLPLPSTGQSDNLSFFERFLNLILDIMVLRPIFNRLYETGDPKYEAVLGGKILFSYLFQLPLIVTTVFGLDYPKERYAHVNLVGPMVMDSHPPIEKELLDWLNSKTNKTVIFISQGATGVLKAENAENLLKGVMATPYHALWVIKKENRKDTLHFDVYGERLFMAEWVPRQPVLKHRAILMTILHCGLNSVQESLSNSLPIICTPLGYDHFDVAMRVSNYGVGVGLYGIMESQDIKPEKAREAIEHVISSDCATNASRIRRMFKLAGGRRRAAELIEFYAEVGYDHLVPSYVKYEWSWVQYYNIDVWVLLLGACGVVGWLSWRFMRFTCKTCCR